jgi:hypothetical protein
MVLSTIKARKKSPHLFYCLTSLYPASYVVTLGIVVEGAFLAQFGVFYICNR